MDDETAPSGYTVVEDSEFIVSREVRRTTKEVKGKDGKGTGTEKEIAPSTYRIGDKTKKREEVRSGAWQCTAVHAASSPCPSPLLLTLVPHPLFLTRDPYPCSSA